MLWHRYCATRSGTFTSNTTTPEDDRPSCSAEESRRLQEPYTNQTLAMHALAMLTQLLRYNETSYHGGFINAQSGIVQPIPVPALVGTKSPK